MPPTAFADVNELLAALLPGLRDVLGGRLRGVYLFGSVVTGDYDADVSDIDMLAVLDTPLTPAEFAWLQAHYDEVASAMPEWRDRIEVLHVSAEALRDFRQSSSPIAVISPGEPLNVKPAGIEWLMNWWMARELGQTLFGPPPSEFIGPISNVEYIEVIRGYGREICGRLAEKDSRRWQAYVTLTLCRAMHTCVHGPTVSKRAAAEWVAARFPQWAPLIHESLAARAAWRHNEPGTRDSHDRTSAFMEFALARLT